MNGAFGRICRRLRVALRKGGGSVMADFALVLLLSGMTGCGGAASNSATPPDLDFAWIPPGIRPVGSWEATRRSSPRSVSFQGFWLGRREVTTAEFAAYLLATDLSPSPKIQDLIRWRGKWKARWFCGRYPVRGLSREEAEAYSSWLGSRHRRIGRLPSADEWETAARGGIESARYPWGWGNPHGRACFAASGPSRTGRYPPNGYGLRDMAGNVFEWCSAGTNPVPAIACGGAWSEPDARRLRVFERTEFAPEYRGQDVGFRVLLCVPPPSDEL